MWEKELACLRAISNIEWFLMWIKEIPDWIYQNIDNIFTYLTESDFISNQDLIFKNNK